MKILYVYLIPLIWVIIGILYARSIPKDGFNGVGEVVITLVTGIILLICVIVYHIRRKN
jgi:hypothetical protein